MLPKFTEKNDPKIQSATNNNQKFLQPQSLRSTKKWSLSLLTELQIIPSKFYLCKYYYCFQVMTFQTLRRSSKRSSTLWNQKIKIQTWIATRRLKNSERKSGVFTIKDNLCRMPTHSQWEMKTLWCHRWGREKHSGHSHVVVSWLDFWVLGPFSWKSQ